MPLLLWIVIFRVDIRWWLTRWAMGSMTCASCTTGSPLCSLHISIFDRIVLHKLRPKTSISAFPLKSMVPSLLRCTLTMSAVLIKCWGFEEDTRKESGKGLFGLGGYKCRDTHWWHGNWQATLLYPSQVKVKPYSELWGVQTSDVPAQAWPQSPGFGPALSGSGFTKSWARPKGKKTAWPGLALAQARAYDIAIETNRFKA